MTTWIGSDFHFGHNNIMKFCPETRGHFRDINHMHDEMIRMWNETVMPEDTVYMLGDIAFMAASHAANILRSLNGRKILIKGNHDSKTVKDKSFAACFDEIHDYLEIRYDGHHVVMFHYPILEWDRCHHGAIQFHGHLHQNPSGLERYRVRNVGWDYTGRFLSTMEEMIADALKGEIKAHNGRTNT
jgi:calcineurin-like phosphoesterase family protein